ncbi:MAG: transglycosylase domain-containing protein [Deltaproteobacteria bacterium]|nr:transglycosylase domain-containing protein [Deltaproteobacteria bacterium]
MLVALPRVAASLASDRIDRLAASLPGTLDRGEVSLSGFPVLRLSRLAWRDGEDWSVEASNVRVEIEPFAVLFGGPPVRSVGVEAVRFRLGDPVRPLAGPEAALDRLRSLAKPVGTRPGGPDPGARTLPGSLPDVRIARIEGRVELAGGAAAATDGSLDLRLADGSLDASARALSGSVRVRIGGGVERRIDVEAALSGREVESASARVAPSVSMEIAGAAVGASGLSWKPGGIEVLSPAWNRTGRWSVSAQSIAVRWDDVPDESGALRDLLQPGLPPAVARLLAARTVREIVVGRPTLDVVLAAAPEPPVSSQSDPGDDAAEPDDRHEGAFRRNVSKAFARLERAVAVASGTVAVAAKRLPAARVAVHGATVRYVEPGANPAEPGTSLANLDLLLQREAGGRVLGRVTFECPEAPAKANEIRFAADPERGALTGSLKAARLPLHPYRAGMPAWLTAGRTTVLRDTDVTFDLAGPEGPIMVKGTVGIEGAGVHLPAVATAPMRSVSFEMQGTLAADVRAGSVRVTGGRFSLSRIRIPIELDASSLGTAPHIRAAASVERIRAQELLESLPVEAVPALEGVRLAGSFAAAIELDLDTRNLGAMKLDFRPDVADLVAIDLGRGVNLDLLRRHFFHRIEEGGGKVVNRVIGPASSDWVPYHEVPRVLIDALTTGEDSQFFTHHGFSVAGIRRSLQVNLERGGLYQGASTLSQQLVKNLFLSREKTLARKLQEVFITWQLEKFLDKEKILELYLNVIEWGPEVYGLRQAAMHYFGKLPRELDLLECAYLVSIIPNPRMFHKHFENGAPSPAFDARVKGLVREMARRGLVQQESADAVRDRRLRFVPQTPPPPSDEGLGLEPPGPPPEPPEFE